MWCLNIITQERNRSRYSHKPLVQRWTTLPSSSRWCWRCWTWWRCNREWLRQWFPLQSSQGQPPFRVFRVSLPPPLGNTRGGLYIVGFRSNPTIWDENRRQSTLEAPTSLGGAAYRWDRATWVHSALGAPLRYFFLLRDTDKNIDTRKILVRFEFRKVLKM